VVYIYTKNPIIQQILNDLLNNKVTRTKSKYAQQFSRYKPISKLRNQDFLFIAKDRHKDCSIIYLENGSLKRKGNKYFFDL
jgi:hypothetical protein